MIKRIMRDCNPGEIHLGEKVVSEHIAQNMQTFKIMLDHHNFKFIANDNARQDEYYKFKVICELYTSIAKYLIKQETNISSIFSEQLLIKWIRILNEWIVIYKLQQQNFIQETLQKIFTIFYVCSIDDHDHRGLQDYDTINDQTSQLSQEIKKLILGLEKMPNDINSFKGFKKIIFQWGLTIVNQTPQIQKIIKKLVENCFNIGCADSSIDMFDAAGVSTTFKKMLGKQISLYFFTFYQKLQEQNINNKYHDKVKIYGQLINRLSIIISTKIPLDSFHFVIDKFYRIYVRYAHIWPVLGSYRLWIVQNNREINDSCLQNRVDLAISTFKILDELVVSSMNEGVFHGNLSNSYEQFEKTVYNLIHSIHLKRMNESFSQQFYTKYFRLLIGIQGMYQSYCFEQDISNEQNNLKLILNNLTEIKNEYKIVIRYLLTNSNRLLNNKQQQFIIKNIILYYDLILQKESYYKEYWQLINLLLGFNKLKSKSILQSKQILGTHHRYTAKFNTSLEHQPFIPFNFASTLYTAIRHKYSQILQKAFTQAYQTPQNEQIWLNIQNLLFMSVNISGSCNFNNKLIQKSKLDMVLGIYFQQYTKLSDVLSNQKQNQKIILNTLLQFQKRKILYKFYQFIKNIKLKIQQKSKINPYQNRIQNRFRIRQNSVQDIFSNLTDMGYEREYIQLALENIEFPDQNLALEWIDNNRSVAQQRIMTRAIERLRNSNRGPASRVEEKVVGDGIIEISLQKFRRQVVGDPLKKLIKVVYKALFQHRVLQQANRLKDILFILMDSFDEKNRMKQYGNFNDKIFKDIEMIQKQQNYGIKLGILLSILQTFSQKIAPSRPVFYDRQMNIKLLRLLPKVIVEEDRSRILTVLNAYLPIITSQILTYELQQYLIYLLDEIYEYKLCNKKILQLFYKIVRSTKQELIQRVTRNILYFLQLGLIKQNIVGILNNILQSDRDLSLVNAQLDLKTYIYQRYKHRINTFDPYRQHVLQIDIKQFSLNFNKYDKNSSIYEVSRKLLSKKKLKNRYFYYDCRKQQNQFYYSIYNNNNFINYKPKLSHQNIISLLINILIKNQSNSDLIIIQLHKILAYYKILIPFAISYMIEGKTLLNWLVDDRSLSKPKFKLLLFLTLNNNICIKIDQTIYGFYSIADYICAKLVDILAHQISNQKATLSHYLSALYLQQIRKFSQFSVSPLIKNENMNLRNILQQGLLKANGMNYLVIGEILNIQYKVLLLNNLRRKYKIVGSENESYYDRQFLKLSSFYNELPIKQHNIVQQKKGRHILMQSEQSQSRVQGQLDSDSQEQNGQQLEQRNVLEHTFINRYGLRVIRRQQFMPLQYQQIITPIQHKNIEDNGKQMEIEPLELINNVNIQEIISIFQHHLTYNNHRQQYKINKLSIDKLKKIKFSQKNIQFKVVLNDGFVDIDLKIKKNYIFQKHFGDILHIIDTNIIWIQKGKQQNQSADRRVDQLSRRIFSTRGLNIESRNQMITHLQRLMIRGRQEQQLPQNPPRILNVNQIYNHIPQFAQPIVPQIQPEPIDEEKKEQIVQQVLPQIQVQNIPIQPAANIEIPPNQPQRIVQQIQQPQNINSAQIQQNNINERIPIEISIQHPIVSQPPERPLRDRQILRIFGLPQTFLRDMGIDQESFDSLPQDFQQEQLMHFISQQNTQNRPNENRNSNPQPAVMDQVSENVAFLASLDMQTRAQVLIQATPQFLSSLPVHIRQQAQNYRHNQINRIIEQQQIEQQKNYRQRGPINIVYPKLIKQQFSKIDDTIAKKFFQRIFYKYPDYKTPSIKILLENKQTQQKTIATIIAILKYYQYPKNDIKIEGIELMRQNGQLIEKKTIITKKQFCVALLHTIYQHLKIPIYKDQQFLINVKEMRTYLPQLQYVFTIDDNQQNQDNNDQKIIEQIKINPLAELFTYSLQIYKPLCVQLIKFIKDLPVKTISFMIQSIEDEMFPRQIYNNLYNFSDNITFKRIFYQKYKQKIPKIQVLAPLLKYNFSHLPNLRQIHQKTLKNYSHSYLDFYNQIFRIYTLQNLHEVQSMLINYKNVHCEAIKFILQAGKDIEKQPIAILLKRPQLLDFQTKKYIFRNHPKIRKISRHRVHIEVDRAQLFQGSYNQLMSRSVRQLEGRIQVSFLNQPGYDAGGLKRQWFLVVSRQIFNQDYALFQKSSSGSTYQPNPKSYINPDHLNYFKFIGRFIGKALVERELIDAYFTRAFYKMILGQELEFKDLQAQDYEFYKSMQWLKNHPIDENMFTFSYIYDNFGNKIEKQLIPGGRQIIVNEQNKIQYIEKYCLAKMRDDFSKQIQFFLEGFHQIVPQQCITCFEAKELELLISGVPTVQVEDLKKNVDYSGYTPTDQIIVWFWEVVEAYTQQNLAKLVQFITGTSKIPVEGFSQLVGMNGVQRISIHKDPCSHQLPKSHTCFNQLDLPNYASKEILKQKLDICLAWGSEGFGFM